MDRFWEPLCLAAFLTLAGCQIFLPPVTGLSDNNDFVKVLGPADICQSPVETLNTWFVTGYEAGPKCRWASGFVSSEILFLDFARWLSRPFTGRYYFDIRASAALHLLILALAFWLMLMTTRRQAPFVRFLLPPLAILMFTDVAYVAWLNSAYMDNASWVFFLLLAAIAARQRSALAYSISGMLLVFSKTQHAVLALPFAALAAWYAWRTRGDARTAWLASALALLGAATVMPALTPPDYRNISLYNAVFRRLAPIDPAILSQLGLDSTYRQYAGTQAFAPESPLGDPDWTRAFLARVSFGSIARFYVRHPAIAFHELDHELHDSVHSMRPSYMANYRQSDGFPPHSVDRRFNFWSELRMQVLWSYPHFLVIPYAIPFLAVLSRRTRSPLLPLALTLACAGIAEFTLCTLADAIDTHRHLFLFHVITDALLLTLVSWPLSYHSH